MKVVAETLGVSRSNLIERLARGAKPRRRYQKAQDAAVLPWIRRLVDARPTYGYRRITALGGRVTWVKSQWKSGANPGQFQVEINTVRNAA